MTRLATLLAVLLSMSTAEFIEVQKLSADALRARFALPAACDPAVTASTMDPGANRMLVAIECRGNEGVAPSALPVSGERRRR